MRRYLNPPAACSASTAAGRPPHRAVLPPGGPLPPRPAEGCDASRSNVDDSTTSVKVSGRLVPSGSKGVLPQHPWLCYNPTLIHILLLIHNHLQPCPRQQHVAQPLAPHPWLHYTPTLIHALLLTHTHLQPRPRQQHVAQPLAQHEAPPGVPAAQPHSQVGVRAPHLHVIAGGSGS